MRFASSLATALSAFVAVGLGSSHAWSQQQPQASDHWTIDRVLTTDPFGAIDVDAAGNSAESIKSWAEARTPAERSELSGRCSVITDPSYAPRFTDFARVLCQRYAEAMSNTRDGKAS
jgi:hypothetical protein